MINCTKKSLSMKWNISNKKGIYTVNMLFTFNNGLITIEFHNLNMNHEFCKYVQKLYLEKNICAKNKYIVFGFL